MVIDGQCTVADVASSLGLVEQILGNWVRRARIAAAAVSDEYLQATEKVEALHNNFPARDEGPQMHHLHTEMRLLLGNGYCERPAQIDCNFETICESCSFFTTGLEFRPTLQQQRDDAAYKGQNARRQVVDTSSPNSTKQALDTDHPNEYNL